MLAVICCDPVDLCFWMGAIDMEHGEGTQVLLGVLVHQHSLPRGSF